MRYLSGTWRILLWDERFSCGILRAVCWCSWTARRADLLPPPLIQKTPNLLPSTNDMTYLHLCTADSKEKQIRQHHKPAWVWFSFIHWSFFKSTGNCFSQMIRMWKLKVKFPLKSILASIYDSNIKITALTIIYYLQC